VVSAKRPTLKQVRDRSRVLSVFGLFNAHTLVMMPTDLAASVLGDLAAKARPDVVEAVENDLARLPKDLAGSALAQSAVALAYEIQNPFNSATSKSMCTRELREALDRLRALAPVKKERTQLDDLRDRRSRRAAS
jgi:hypothetical protein